MSNRLSYINPTDQSSYITYGATIQRKASTQIFTRCIFCHERLTHSKYGMKLAMTKLQNGELPEVGEHGIFFRTVHNECVRIHRTNKTNNRGRYTNG